MKLTTIITLCLAALCAQPTLAQGQQPTAGRAQLTLTLDSCRALALRNNKQLRMARLSRDVALNTKKAARTQYLPKVDAIGAYEFTSREISLLSKSQKTAISNMGTNGVAEVGGTLTSGITNELTSLVQQGVITADQAQQIGSLAGQLGNGPVAQYAAALGNAYGQKIVDAFHTDTRNMFAGAVMLRQPLYMGGAITAANRMADISQDVADNTVDFKTQATIYDIDRTYWTVVSLRQKQKLAYSFRDLVQKLDDDVHKMIKEGVATRADGLKVDVRVNEADMQITQVDNGLTLAKMLLCQLCGLPMDEDVALADSLPMVSANDFATPHATAVASSDSAAATQRPELRLLQNAVDLSEQAVKLTQAAYLPHVALTGGYAISNPNLFNGFQRRFGGVWNVGVMVQVPVWNWFEGKYKIRATKAATSMARMELADAEEKVSLQVTQGRFKLAEAHKRLEMAQKNIASAEENLRCAQVGFREGVMETTDVMAAQTAWQQAHSQLIDAQVDVRLAMVNLQKALGTLE